MPEQVCSGIFYNRCFLSVSIVKILYKAEAKNPEAEVRENATHDFKGGIKDGGGIEKIKTALPNITMPCLTLPCSGLHTPRHHTALHYFA